MYDLCELIQDCRWQNTYLNRIPREILLHILEYKWSFERKRCRKKLDFYFEKRLHETRKNIYELRQTTTFIVQWGPTPEFGMNLKYIIKWGGGFIYRDILFSKTIKIMSKRTIKDPLKRKVNDLNIPISNTESFDVDALIFPFRSDNT